MASGCPTVCLSCEGGMGVLPSGAPAHSGGYVPLVPHCPRQCCGGRTSLSGWLSIAGRYAGIGTLRTCSGSHCNSCTPPSSGLALGGWELPRVWDPPTHWWVRVVRAMWLSGLAPTYGRRPCSKRSFEAP